MAYEDTAVYQQGRVGRQLPTELPRKLDSSKIDDGLGAIRWAVWCFVLEVAVGIIVAIACRL
jgi:hypothetical protein